MKNIKKISMLLVFMIGAIFSQAKVVCVPGAYTPVPGLPAEHFTCDNPGSLCYVIVTPSVVANSQNQQYAWEYRPDGEDVLEVNVYDDAQNSQNFTTYFWSYIGVYYQQNGTYYVGNN